MDQLKQAAQQALEALESLYISNFTMADSPLNNAITALRAALEQPADPAVKDSLTTDNEPVAWRYKNPSSAGFTVFQQYPQALIDMGKSVEALYTCPRPAEPAVKDSLTTDNEPYAWMAVGGTIWRHKTNEDDVPLYKFPQPAAWVGLTPEEVNDCIKFPNRNLFVRDGTTSQRIARAIEAKLREKNGGAA